MSLLSIKNKIGIPSDWKMVPIGKVLVSSQYGTSNGNSDTGVPVVGMKNLQDGKVDFNDLPLVSVDEAEKESLLLHDGDILLNRTNSYDLVGKIGFVKNAIETVFASYLVRLKVNMTKSDPKFVAMWLTSFWANQMIKKIATRAVSQANVNPTEFKKFCLVPVPPLPEQKAIAALLSTWDEAIEKTERLIQAKEKRFKWLLRELISEPRNTQKDPKWKKVKLGDLFGKAIKVEKGKALTKESNTEGNIPVVAGGQTYAYHTNHPTHEIPTVTVSASGAYAGFVWYHDYPIWASDCNVLYATKGVTKFLYFTLKAIQHRVYALQSGGAQPHVYSKDMKNLHIQWPSIEEQQEIAETLSSAQQEIDLLKQLAEKYKTQKRGLMQKMLTGEWRIKPEIINQYMEA